MWIFFNYHLIIFLVQKCWGSGNFSTTESRAQKNSEALRLFSTPFTGMMITFKTSLIVSMERMLAKILRYCKKTKPSPAPCSPTELRWVSKAATYLVLKLWITLPGCSIRWKDLICRLQWLQNKWDLQML